MKVILLAGGQGSRISEHTESIPKPMIEIGNRPILWHIMQTYAYFGLTDFLVALGYKGEMIKDYFLRYHALNSDLTVDLKTGAFTPHRSEKTDWKVTLVDTGHESMTGGRVKRMQQHVGNETCLLTYGDGLADIDIGKLVDFHRRHNKLITVTAVHPGARFGRLKITGDNVTSFKEKPQIEHGWINGGYFVLSPRVMDYIKGDGIVWERQPLEKLSNEGQLSAYKHRGFWQPMDTLRDKNNLEELWISNNAPWKIW